MTKPQTKQTITLETIVEAFENFILKEAREILYDRIGVSLSVDGVIEKVIKRDGGLKIYFKPNGLAEGKTFMVFAEFTDEKEREKVKASKLRKGSKIAITGDFRTAGQSAATMENCIIKLCVD